MKLLEWYDGKMSFATSWINQVMQCVTMISYIVIIDEIGGPFSKPTRGLRQGDPLSPFLFLICNEGLSSLMRLAIWDGLLRGAKASQSGPQISHLLVADDCILFGMQLWEKLMRWNGFWNSMIWIGVSASISRSQQSFSVLTRIMQ